MALEPGDRCMAPPPWEPPPDLVEATYLGPADPPVTPEPGDSKETGPQALVEHDDEVYVVDAGALKPLPAK